MVTFLLLVAVVLGPTLQTVGKPSYVDRLPEDRRDESCGACHLAGDGGGGVMVDVHQICTSCHFISTLDSLQLVVFPTPENVTPVIDGVLEGNWSFSKPTNIKLSGGVADGPPLALGDGWETSISMQALYSSNQIFFALEWEDSTESFTDQAWRQDHKTGLWELPTWREVGQDKLALMWETKNQTAGFMEYGGLATCHILSSQGNEDSIPLMYTNHQDEIQDLWLWMAGLTNPVGQAEDQYLNSSRTGQEGGRHRDGPGVGGQGGYYPNRQLLNNGTANVSVPWYVELMYSPGDPNDKFIITQAEIDSGEAVPITGVDGEGNLYYGSASKLPASINKPAYIVAPFKADLGDLQAKGAWQDGKWTLEVARNLTTSNSYDVQFDDLQSYYLFGLAVFENAGQGHAYHPAAFQLTFSTEPVSMAEEKPDSDWIWAALSGGFFVAMLVLLLVGLAARNLSVTPLKAGQSKLSQTARPPEWIKATEEGHKAKAEGQVEEKDEPD